MDNLGNLDTQGTKKIGTLDIGYSEDEGARINIDSPGVNQEDVFSIKKGPKFADDSSAKAFLEELFQHTAEETKEVLGTNRKTNGNLGTGSTALVGILRQEELLDAEKTRTLFDVAYAGDAVGIVFKVSPDGQVSYKKLTEEHDLENPKEKARIVNEGGEIYTDDMGRSKLKPKMNGKFIDGGGVTPTRGFGDHHHVGMSHEPEIKQYDLSPLMEDGSMLIPTISCDGLYDRVSPEQHAKNLQEFLKNKPGASSQQITEAMTKFALQKSGDNITVLATQIKADTIIEDTVVLKINDGHAGKETAIKAGEAIDSFVGQEAAKEIFIPAQAPKEKAERIALRNEDLSVLPENTVKQVVSSGRSMDNLELLEPTDLGTSIPDIALVGQGLPVGKRLEDDGIPDIDELMQKTAQQKKAASPAPKREDLNKGKVVEKPSRFGAVGRFARGLFNRITGRNPEPEKKEDTAKAEADRRAFEAEYGGVRNSQKTKKEPAALEVIDAAPAVSNSTGRPKVDATALAASGLVASTSSPVIELPEVPVTSAATVSTNVGAKFNRAVSMTGEDDIFDDPAKRPEDKYIGKTAKWVYSVDYYKGETKANIDLSGMNSEEIKKGLIDKITEVYKQQHAENVPDRLKSAEVNAFFRSMKEGNSFNLTLAKGEPVNALKLKGTRVIDALIKSGVLPPVDSEHSVSTNARAQTNINKQIAAKGIDAIKGQYQVKEITDKQIQQQKTFAGNRVPVSSDRGSFHAIRPKSPGDGGPSR